MSKKKEIRTIVKINAPLSQANEWTKNAKQLKISRSEYLLDIINKNNQSQQWFSIEKTLKKLKKVFDKS